jgi:hypothetical protein
MNNLLSRVGRFALGFGVRVGAQAPGAGTVPGAGDSVRRIAARWRALVCVMLLACAVVAMPGCEKKVTQENFDLIATGAEGMTIDRVKAILGEGEKQEQTGVSLSGGFGVPGSNRSTNTDTVVYMWKDNRREITVTFRNGKAIDKNKGGF